jgi:mono/diheme cytochrome c family protein
MSRGSTLGVLFVAAVLTACRQDMHDQPRHEALEASGFFADGRSARPRVSGTVARGERELDEHLESGRVAGELVDSFPFPVTQAVLDRGRERYAIFCSPCHGQAGAGDGTVVRRGLKPPTSFSAERLRAAPAGYFFEAITRGFGVMLDLSDRIEPRDRWAIVAWVRALQLSQGVSVDELSQADRLRLEEGSGE